MGSCVSKKAGAGREGNKVAAPLPPVKEINTLSPVAEEEEEEVKEVVLSETPAPRPPPMEKREELSTESDSSGNGSDSTSMGSVAREKAMAKAGGEQEVVKRAVDAYAPEKARARRMASPEKSKPKPKQHGGAGNARARSPSPSSAHRRQQPGWMQSPPTRLRREPAVVSGIGCRSGRFSPSAARRAAESAAVRRTQSAREADMALPAKRSLNASINGNVACFGGRANALSRRDLGERSGRRSESPTPSKRPSPARSPVHRQARGRAGRESYGGSTTERGSGRPRVREVGPDDAGRGGDEQPASAGSGATEGGGGEQKKAQEGALGQSPSVAMECFIFL